MLAGVDRGHATTLPGRPQRFLLSTAAWSWRLLIFERPFTPSFLASA